MKLRQTAIRRLLPWRKYDKLRRALHWFQLACKHAPSFMVAFIMLDIDGGCDNVSDQVHADSDSDTDDGQTTHRPPTRT